jgi:hypothetical protein
MPLLQSGVDVPKYHSLVWPRAIHRIGSPISLPSTCATNPLLSIDVRIRSRTSSRRWSRSAAFICVRIRGPNLSSGDLVAIASREPVQRREAGFQRKDRIALGKSAGGASQRLRVARRGFRQLDCQLPRLTPDHSAGLISSISRKPLDGLILHDCLPSSCSPDLTTGACGATSAIRTPLIRRLDQTLRCRTQLDPCRRTPGCYYPPQSRRSRRAGRS